MIENVLVPMDGSKMAERALEFAIHAHPDAEITVLYVAGGASPMMGEALEIALADDIEAKAREHATDIFERAEDIASSSGIELTTVVRIGAPARAINRAATEYDVVVIGSHGRHLVSRMLIGDVAKTVARRCPVPVTIVR